MLPRQSILLSLLMLLSTSHGFSQDQPKGSPDTATTLSREFNGADVVLAKTKYPPGFPGGKPAWTAYLKATIKLAVPLVNRAPSGIYNVLIRFAVESDGTIQHVAAESNCGYGMETEVTRCIKVSPKWNPAQTAKKQAVTTITRQLIVFKIKGTDIEMEVK